MHMWAVTLRKTYPANQNKGAGARAGTGEREREREGEREREREREMPGNMDRWLSTERSVRRPHRGQLSNLWGNCARNIVVAQMQVYQLSEPPQLGWKSAYASSREVRRISRRGFERSVRDRLLKSDTALDLLTWNAILIETKVFERGEKTNCWRNRACQQVRPQIPTWTTVEISKWGSGEALKLDYIQSLTSSWCGRHSSRDRSARIPPPRTTA